jgi:hypothetical protein
MRESTARETRSCSSCLCSTVGAENHRGVDLTGRGRGTFFSGSAQPRGQIQKP